MATTTDSLSRLLNLYLMLANARQPMTLEEITRELGGFPTSFDARRQAFERAKRDLRSLGLPIVTTRDLSGTTDAYIVDSREGVDLAPSLTPMEALALAGAMASVRFGPDAALDSATKIGCMFDGEVAALANLPKVPLISELFGALHRNMKVSFAYHDKARTLCPYGIVFRWGNWYLVGREEDSEITKSFRVDFIQGSLTALGKSCTPPTDLVISEVIPETRAAIPEGDLLEVVLSFRSELRDVVGGTLPALADLVQDGAMLVGKVEVGSFESFVKVVVEFSEVLEVREPATIKERIRGWVARSMASQETAVAAARRLSDFGRDAFPLVSGDFNSSAETRKGQDTTLVQFRRVMTMLPWLYRNPSTTTAEISRLFNIDPDRVGGLLERIACCGLPPFTPDRLIEIIVDGDDIQARISDEFATGLKLDSGDLFVVALSAKIALAAGDFEGRVELESALEKIFGRGSAEEIGDSIVIDFEGDRNLGKVRSALETHRQLKFEYFSSSKAELTTRLVDPFALFSQREFWYLRGWCHNSGGVRNFRLDRMDGIEILETPSLNQPSAQDLLPSTFSIDEGDFAAGKAVVLEVERDALWRVNGLMYRSVSAKPDNDATWVEIRVLSDRWLAKLVASAGGEIRVVYPLETSMAILGEIQQIATRLA